MRIMYEYIRGVLFLFKRCSAGENVFNLKRRKDIQYERRNVQQSFISSVNMCSDCSNTDMRDGHQVAPRKESEYNGDKDGKFC